MKNNKLANGYTLLELLVVLAIISILAAVAIPAYLDYTIKTKVGEGLSLLSGIKYTVGESMMAGVAPSTNAEAGMADAALLTTDYINEIRVSAGGVLTVEFSIADMGANNKLQFVPTQSDEGIEWTCQPAPAGGVLFKHLPSECK